MGLAKGPHRDKPSPQNCGKQSRNKFTWGWAAEKPQNTCIWREGAPGLPAPFPAEAARGAPGTMRSGRCFQEGARAGKAGGGFERGTAGRAAERPAVSGRRAWLPSLCLAHRPRGRMNLERLRKRVRQYIDQVRRRGSDRWCGAGWSVRGKGRLAHWLSRGRAPLGPGAAGGSPRG